jgi:lysophospholipase L1-like esterase
MLALIGALAAAQAPAPALCEAGPCSAGPLAPFLSRLRETRPGSGAPLHILQIGDSHTAGDMITQAWRRRLQARYGAGGRGVLAPGRPYPGYLTFGVTASQSGGWRTHAAFGDRYREGGAPLGLSGFTQTARQAGETLGLAADTLDSAFDRMTVCAIAGPGAATIALRLGGTEQSWALEAPLLSPSCRTIATDAPAAAASVTTLDEGVASITSIAVFRGQSGVVLSNLGVSGAQLAHFGRSDDGVVRAELAAYRPDLIVLAFGTNEGFSPGLTAAAYEAGLRAQIARLRRLAGGEVPILLLGPPDAATRDAGLADMRAGCGEGWHRPRLLAAVRERQRAVARELGVGFWDWQAAMGGRCAAHRWRRAGLMRGDHVHFTRAGGELIGAAIDADIERGASAFAGSRP